MSIVVTCTCGKSFRAKEEHVGKSAKCRACGKTLVIAEAPPEYEEQEEEVITFNDDAPNKPISSRGAGKPKPQQRVQQRVRAPEPEPEPEEPEAEAEGEPEEDLVETAPRRKGKSNSSLIIVAGLVVAALIVAVAIYLILSPRNPSADSGKKKSLEADDPLAKAAPADAEYFDAVRWDKTMLGIQRSLRVKLQGTVSSTMTEDGSIVVLIGTETREKGGITTYKMRLYPKEKLTQPVATGIDIVFKGRLQPKPKQDYPEHMVGDPKIPITYEMAVKDVEILGTPAAK
ncbi:MAG TPA: hypothetical protein VGP72_26325 [Planctomycetota bacterium]